MQYPDISEFMVNMVLDSMLNYTLNINYSMYVYIQGTYKAPGPTAKVHSGPFKLPGEYNCY